MPEPRQRYYNNNGTLAAGCLLYTYASGTSTPKATYTDYAGTTPHANPIVLDSKGEALIYWDGAYKVDLKTAAGVQITGYPVDNYVSVDTLIAASDTTLRADLAASTGASMIGGGDQMVNSIAALRALLKTSASKYAFATGYYAAGDGGGGNYWYDSTDTTSADNGGTVIVATDGGRWKLVDTSTINVKTFGAKSDGVTDDTAAIQAAINFISTAGGYLDFPPLTHNYTALTLATAGTAAVILTGPGATLRKTTGTGTGLLLQSSGARRQNCVIQGLRFTHSVAQTAGETIKLEAMEHTVLRDVRIDAAFGGIYVKDCFDTHFDGVTYLRNNVSYDIKLQGSSATPTCIDTYFGNVLGEGTAGNVTKIGLIVDSGVSGVYGVNSDFTQGLIGVNVQNTVAGGVRPEFLFFTSVLTDTTATSGWLMNADCKGVYYDGCWAGTAGGTGSGWAISNGTGHLLNHCKGYNNARDGVTITGAAEVSINGGQYSGNSLSSANTYDGIQIAAGTSGFSITNVRAGNISGLGGGTQRYGIAVAAGSSDNYKILGNDVRGNGTAAGLIDGGTGVNKRLHDNLGWNPRGYLGAVAVPASTVTQNNTFGIDATVYVAGGTVSAIEINAGAGFVTTGIIAGPVRLPAGAQIRLTYTVAPTWVWFGD